MKTTVKIVGVQNGVTKVNARGVEAFVDGVAGLVGETIEVAERELIEEGQTTEYQAISNRYDGPGGILLSSCSPDAFLRDLPESEFLTGTPIADAIKLAGFDESASAVISQNGWWNLAIKQLAEELDAHASATA